MSRLIESLECGVKNVIIIQSLAGGTGSGVGSYLSQLISDAYPFIFQVAFLISPVSRGEIII
jgi:hypothetical protein